MRSIGPAMNISTNSQNSFFSLSINHRD
ncbi:MAG: hypothetical protein UV34_C0029G0022, partial [Parcubacteria group bacterium GW2011_GWB1_42_6]